MGYYSELTANLFEQDISDTEVQSRLMLIELYETDISSEWVQGMRNLSTLFWDA